MCACRASTQISVIDDSLYHSLQGQYFVGNTDSMTVTNGSNSWVGLVNPNDSGVNLFVNVWTVSNFGNTQLQTQIWFDSAQPNGATKSCFVTSSNLAIRPVPRPKVEIIKAFGASVQPPSIGIKAFERVIPPGQTVAEEENGKFIIPPGGNFAIFLTPAQAAETVPNVSVAYGWWETRACIYL